jgi:hypothetical protein
MNYGDCDCKTAKLQNCKTAELFTSFIINNL